MLVQNGMAYKPEKTILAVGSREGVTPEFLSGRRARQVCSSQSMNGGEDTLGAGWGGLNPVSLQYSQVCFVPLAPPGNTRGMVFRSVQSFGVITDGKSNLLGSLCTVLSINYRSGAALCNVVNTTYKRSCL